MSGDDTTILMTIEVVRVKFSGRDGWCTMTARRDDLQPDGAGNIPAHMQRDGNFTVVGVFDAPKPGDLFDVEGVIDRHPKYGWQFKAQSVMECIRRDTRGLWAFLRRLKHIGPQRANKIMEHWQRDADAIFEMLDNNPEQLCVVEGINEERAKEIAADLIELEGERDAFFFLRALGVRPQLQGKIIDRLAGQTRRIIEADPFALMTSADIGFEHCDDIRKALGIPENDARRLAAGTLLLVQAAGRGGDVWSTERNLMGAGVSRDVDETRRKVNLKDEHVRVGLDLLAQPTDIPGTNVTLPPRIVVDGERIYLADDWTAELTIATRLTRMLAA